MQQRIGNRYLDKRAFIRLLLISGNERQLKRMGDISLEEIYLEQCLIAKEVYEASRETKTSNLRFISRSRKPREPQPGGIQ